MSNQTREYRVQTEPARRLLKSPVSSDSQEEVKTDEIGPIEQSPIRSSLVDAWLKALQSAEALHLCLNPTYLRHSEQELVALVQAALRGRREPSQLVADLLAHGGRSAKQHGATCRGQS